MKMQVNRQSLIVNRKPEMGMSLVAVMAVLTLVAIGLLAIAPSVMQGVQREKELEAIRRGEEVAEAVRQYIVFYRKLPTSIDDLLEGIPQGTKKRQILRPSAAVDPLSADGKWRLIEPTAKSFQSFGRRVQAYNNGSLPASPEPRQIFDAFVTTALVNINSTADAEDLQEDSDDEIEIKTDKTSFIGVASQSRSRAIIAYYGIENHSKWIFTPLFRGVGATATNPGAGLNTNRPPGAGGSNSGGVRR